MTLQNSKKADWGEPVKLSAEEIILWLESHRNWMHEIWTQNPDLRKKWEKINETNESVESPGGVFVETD